MTCIHTSASSLPGLLRWDWGLTKLSSPVLAVLVTKTQFDPVSVILKIVVGCTVVLSVFLVVLRMWVKKSWEIPESSHWGIPGVPDWPSQDFSTPNYWHKGSKCPGEVPVVDGIQSFWSCPNPILQRAAFLPALLLLSKGSGCAFLFPANKEVIYFFPFQSKLLVHGGLWYRDPLFLYLVSEG